MSALLAHDFASPSVLSNQPSAHSTLKADSAPIGVGRFDAQKRLVERNSHFAPLLGLPFDHIHLGMSFEELVTACRVSGGTPCGQVAGLLHMDGIIAKQSRRFERTVPGGRRVQFHVTPTDDGGLVIAGTDITPPIAHDARLTVSDQLQVPGWRADRNQQEDNRREKALRERLLSRMAQELRTPLNVICGLVQVTQSTELTPVQAGHLTHIQQAARQLQVLIGGQLEVLEDRSSSVASGSAYQPEMLINWSPIAANESPATYAHTLADLGPTPLQGMRILLAEDDPRNQMVARELLAALGADVEVAVDGLDTLTWLVRGGDFDAVVMDWQMPHMNGLEATREIRLMVGFENLPIIALSANATAADQLACLDAGMNTHLSKPVHGQALVHALLVHARGMSVAPPEPIAETAPATVWDFQLEHPVVQDTVTIHREAAIHRLGGDIALYEQMAGLFRTDAPLMIQAIADARRSGQRPHVARLAHTLKSLAGGVGADELAEAAQMVEDLFQAPAGGADTGALTRLEIAVRRALASLVDPWHLVTIT